MDEAFNGIALIEQIQQNRAPWLMVDRIDVCIPGKSVTATKNFSVTEWFFAPDTDHGFVVPGFIVLESMVQAFIMTFLSMDKYRAEQTADISINDIELHEVVTAGDTLRLEAELQKVRFGIATGSSSAWRGDVRVANADMVVAIPSELRRMSPGGNK